MNPKTERPIGDVAIVEKNVIEEIPFEITNADFLPSTQVAQYPTVQTVRVIERIVYVEKHVEPQPQIQGYKPSSFELVWDTVAALSTFTIAACTFLMGLLAAILMAIIGTKETAPPPQRRSLRKIPSKTTHNGNNVAVQNINITINGNQIDYK